MRQLFRLPAALVATPVLCAVVASSSFAQQATPAAVPNAPTSTMLATPVTPVAPSQHAVTPSATTTTNSAHDVVAPAPANGPTVDAARAGVAPRVSKERTMAPMAEQHVGAGQNVALMVVGGAALITGLIIGGDGGTLIAVGGAAVGLYGLYNFIK